MTTYPMIKSLSKNGVISLEKYQTRLTDLSPFAKL
jgi:hypothetical protein